MNQKLELEFIPEGLDQITWDRGDGPRRYSPKGSVIIIGAGGLGWWLTAALMRCDDLTNEFVIYDDDDFQGGNGAKRLPRPGRVDRKKVNELSGWLTEWCMGAEFKRLTAKSYRFTHTNLYGFNRVALIVDCTDAPISTRIPIYQEAWNNGIPVVRGSYDGEMITFGYRPPDSVVDDGGYNLIPNMAVTFAAAGMVAESVRRVLKGESVKPYTYHFGPVWRSATGNENEQVEIQEAIGRGIEEEMTMAEQIRLAIEEGDPLVIGVDGEILGRESEFEVVEEEEDFFDEANLADEDDYDEEEASNNASTYSYENELQAISNRLASVLTEQTRREIFGTPPLETLSQAPSLTIDRLNEAMRRTAGDFPMNDAIFSAMPDQVVTVPFRSIAHAYPTPFPTVATTFTEVTTTEGDTNND